MWVSVQTSDLLGAYNATQLRALSETHRENGQPDPLASAISVVIARIRGNILSWQHNQVDVDETLIPPELQDDAIWLCVERLNLGFPETATALSEAQKTRIKQANDRLDKISRGDLRVSPPNTPSTAQAQVFGGVQRIYSPRDFKPRGLF